MLPGWKAGLLSLAGRLVLVKAVLTAVPIHLLIALDVPGWLIRMIDKRRRAFLWKGRLDVRGGHCSVAWEWFCRPLDLGGLGIHNLVILGWALRMRWLWLSKTEPYRPWAALGLQVHRNVQDMFAISVVAVVGDGLSMLFWTDRWIHGRSVRDLAPALFSFVPRRAVARRSVRDALHSHGCPVPVP